MIRNGTLASIAIKTGVTAGGDPVYASPATLDVRICVSLPTRQQRYALGAVIAEADAVLYMLLDELGETAVGLGDKVTVVNRRGETVQYEVLHVRTMDKAGGLSNVEVFGKEAL